MLFRDFVEQAVDEVARRVEKYQLNVCFVKVGMSSADDLTISFPRHCPKIIILSGGFAESPYFQRVVANRLARPGRTIVVTNHPV
jgi:hypothetical protein